MDVWIYAAGGAVAGFSLGWAVAALRAWKKARVEREWKDAHKENAEIDFDDLRSQADRLSEAVGIISDVQQKITRGAGVGKQVIAKASTASLASCPGRRNGNTCGTLLYRCNSCGNVGCGQNACSNVAFPTGSNKCGKCGKYEKKTFSGEASQPDVSRMIRRQSD